MASNVRVQVLSACAGYELTATVNAALEALAADENVCEVDSIQYQHSETVDDTTYSVMIVYRIYQRRAVTQAA